VRSIEIGAIASMKRIKIENANRYLRCDDEDYETLIKYKWYLCPNGCGKKFRLRTWRKDKESRVSPIFFLYPTQREGFGFIFRDRDVCNYQRYNIQWYAKEDRRKVTSAITISHCPLGHTILRPKRTDGRSEACFVCLEEAYESYYICLDLVSHQTYWKGWIRHDAG
jgi:hypothetical protein